MLLEERRGQASERDGESSTAPVVVGEKRLRGYGQEIAAAATGV
uniref:Uncharacterized protein n=1 Tax=Rhizophora mucronata TaxID=61149 RepID=A0A2P2N8L9_RHIMU